MQKNTSNKRKGRNKLWDARLMITALAVATTVGFWNLFARQALLSQSLTSATNTAAPPQPVESAPIVLPAIPTLVAPLAEQAGQSSLV